MNGEHMPSARIAACQLVAFMRAVSVACGAASVALVAAREHLASGRETEAGYAVGAALRRLFECGELLTASRPLEDCIMAAETVADAPEVVAEVPGSAAPMPSASALPPGLTRSARVHFNPVKVGPPLLSVNAGASAELAREVAETLLASVGDRLRDAQGGSVVGGDEAMAVELALEVAHALLVAARATNDSEAS